MYSIIHIIAQLIMSLCIIWEKGCIDYVSMDSKADSYPLYREFKRQRRMTLVTSSRRKENKTKNRILMHQTMQTPKLKQIYFFLEIKVSTLGSIQDTAIGNDIILSGVY